MGLSERKQKILKAVIDDYINYAEPIGSRHIAKNHDISLSSATIRNELADLEDLGYLIKTHTSSGRIPSNLGYREYVNTLIKKYFVQMQEINELKSEMNRKTKELEFYIKNILDITSRHTNLTAIAMTPDFRKGTIKNIELIMLDPSNIMLILQTDTEMVKSKHIRLKFSVDTGFISKLKIELNNFIAGHTIEELTNKNFEDITRILANDHDAVMEILQFVYETINDINNGDIFLSGETNMLSLPEFKDIEKAKGFLELMHDSEKMKNIIINNTKSDMLNVVIGDEGNNDDTKSLSIILSPYKITDTVYGAIGVIGPTRMNYEKVISSLDSITKTLTEGLTERNE